MVVISKVSCISTYQPVKL